MKQFMIFLFFGSCFVGHAQYHFRGEVPVHPHHKVVYLSIVDNYRKSERIYADQIIQKAAVDTLGNFVFEGNHLATENNIYRIHIDNCNENLNGTNHFLKQCNSIQSVLFVANNNDSINLPLLRNNQALCEINSTNSKSGYLLAVESLKEEMILDFMDYTSKAGESLNYKKWFKTLQDFGRNCEEPLVELYVYNLLSNRANETHDYYLTDLTSNAYYDDLAKRLIKEYPNTPLTLQYQKELKGDKSSFAAVKNTTYIFDFKWVLSIIMLLIILVGLFLFRRKRHLQNNHPIQDLTAQETTIMHKIVEGKSNKEIASELYISVSTVKTHINNLYKKLGVSSRSDIKAMR